MNYNHHRSTNSANKRRDDLHRLPILDEESVLKRFFEEGISEDHAYKVWRHIIQRNVKSVHEIPGLPKSAYNLLDKEFSICTSEEVKRYDNKDGSTTKLVITLQDGKLLECVIMRYGSVKLSSFPKDKSNHPNTGDNSFKSNKRSILCVSSQIGCQMGCNFCATGTMGLQGNLIAGEILEQVYLASRIEKIRNIVFMGMGEPLDNYNEVISAIRAMVDVRRFQLSSHHITVSTVGIASRIKQLAVDAPGVRLALSLHAPNQELRSQLIPAAKSWSMKKILEATDFFVNKQKIIPHFNNQIVMFEYVLIDSVNDSEEIAHELGNLLSARASNALLNIIPYNPTISAVKYSPPTQATIDLFISIIKTYGVKVTVRQELGQDIDSACGQLVIIQGSLDISTNKTQKSFVQNSPSEHIKNEIHTSTPSSDKSNISSYTFSFLSFSLPLNYLDFNTTSIIKKKIFNASTFMHNTLNKVLFKFHFYFINLHNSPIESFIKANVGVFIFFGLSGLIVYSRLKFHQQNFILRF